MSRAYAAPLDNLTHDPMAGTYIGRGCYKVRMSIGSKGKGKSGGARVITYVRVINKVVVLLTMYDKSEKENITEKERDHLIALAEEL
ncbi:MAG: type II toxin-antitoxin system RelE/ParE family toxin [Flavobacteriales bacterium]|nr:type II toxin-antitoxin system RelE/ParE family toxin [Flavobacteriales bacterium]